MELLDRLLQTRTDTLVAIQELNNSIFQDVVGKIKASTFERSTDNPEYAPRLIFTQVPRKFVHNTAVINKELSDLKKKIVQRMK